MIPQSFYQAALLSSLSLTLSQSLSDSCYFMFGPLTAFLTSPIPTACFIILPNSAFSYLVI